jgi:hypothetical protein
VRVTLSRAIALSAVLMLPVACGTSDQPVVEQRSTASAGSTPSATPAPVELTKANFAPRIFAALKARGTFQVETSLLDKGSWDEAGAIRTRVRMKGAVTDLAVVDGRDQLLRVGSTTYLLAADWTGSTNRPWAKVNPRSTRPGERAVAKNAEALLQRGVSFEMLGATAYATGFKRGGQITIETVDTQEYLFTIDLQKAVAANALAGFVDRNDVKTMAKSLSVSIAVDDKDLPRRMEFVLADADGRATHVRATFRGFGQGVNLAAPPAARVGKVS